jgi:hypothetical protein
MEQTTAQHFRPFLIALAAVAIVSACIDVALREWLQAASSGCLLIGVLAFRRSLHYHSVRWRAFAGIALVLAIALHIARFALA